MKTSTAKGGEATGAGGYHRSHPVRERDFWEGRAEEFSDYAAETGYAAGFLGIMNVDPDWTVLDMACAGGTLAIPLARRVKRIIAVDFSRNMLDILSRRCREGGITNIDAVLGRWEDDWDALGIGPCDVAIASRSLLAEDVRGSLIKLDRAAKRQVYISTSVGDGPFDRRLFEATGRRLSVGPDYIYYYTLLYEMGIRANIAFVREDHNDDWGSREEAVAGQRWMFHDLTGEEEEKVRAYLDAHIVYRDRRWRLPYERGCAWAVMWWDKK